MAMATKSIKLYNIMKGKFSEEEAAEIVDCVQPMISEERLNSFATKEDLFNSQLQIQSNFHKWIVGTGIALASLVVGMGGLLYSAL